MTQSSVKQAGRRKMNTVDSQELPGGVPFTETERRWWAQGGGGGREFVLQGDRGSVWEDEKVLETGGSGRLPNSLRLHWHTLDYLYFTIMKKKTQKTKNLEKNLGMKSQQINLMATPEHLKN